MTPTQLSGVAAIIHIVTYCDNKQSKCKNRYSKVFKTLCSIKFVCRPFFQHEFVLLQCFSFEKKYGTQHVSYLSCQVTLYDGPSGSIKFILASRSFSFNPGINPIHQLLSQQQVTYSFREISSMDTCRIGASLNISVPINLSSFVSSLIRRQRTKLVTASCSRNYTSFFTAFT